MSDWHELVIEGAEPACRAFVAGFAAGRRTTKHGIFGRDHTLAHESLGDRVRALFAGGTHHVFFAETALAEPLVDALAKHGSDARLRLERRRIVEAMWFTFRVEAFSRPVATAIRNEIFHKLPAGVHSEEMNESEEDNPSAHGTELYSPVHEYIYRASGRFAGLPPGIVDLHRRMAERDCVTVEGLHVEARTR